jgi:hypothetical protein
MSLVKLPAGLSRIFLIATGTFKLVDYTKTAESTNLNAPYTITNVVWLLPPHECGLRLFNIDR